MEVAFKLLVFTFLVFHNARALPSPTHLQEDPTVTKLRDYLRIQTAHPAPEAGYAQAIEWLREQAHEIGLDFNLIGLGEQGVPHQFALWLTWNGTNPSLKSILLNSHMDVVAAEPEKWTYHPYEAHKDAQGNIYARGASDMKSATVAELAAIKRLKDSGFQPLRTIHLTIMPDEEVGAKRGMVPFLKTDQFKSLNVGIDIDEGFPAIGETVLPVNYAEKSIWHFNVTAHGEASHGSNLPEYTVGQRLQLVINKLMEFRDSEYRKMHELNVSIEHVTSLNLVQIGGGIGDNTIPNELWASFDMRLWLEPGWNFTDAENMILNIAEQARLGSSPNDVSVDFFLKSMQAGRTATDDSNVWWTALQSSCQEMNITCEPHVLTAATDGRFVREVGIPVFGFCPFTSTPATAHQDNEFINEVQFLRGIDRYVTLIQKLAMLPENINP